MRPVGFQGDQTRIPMKTKITSARGGKEVRRDRERCVPNSGRFHCLLFVVGVIGQAAAARSFPVRSPGSRACAQR